jgi:Fur family transcriptional regulator, ferric uptake regulator
MGQYSNALKERGYRLTVQRTLILDAIEAIAGHIGVEDVYSRIHGVYPQVNLSTVYRTMELLEHEGLLTHTHFHDGAALWHRAEEGHHQHLVCERCGARMDLDLAVVAPLERTLRTRYGFAPNLTHFAILGVCQECQRTEAADPPRAETRTS